jgi:colicin import membrane protein
MIPIPTWTKYLTFGLAVAAVVGALLYGRAYYIAVGEATARTECAQANDQRERQDAEADRQREAAERTKEQTRQQEADRIANDQAQKEREQDARNQRAAATTRSLRATIDELNRQLEGLSGLGADPERAALADGARVARELLGSCAERYREVAADADRYRDQVGGLQSFAKHACDAGQADAPQKP